MISGLMHKMDVPYGADSFFSRVCAAGVEDTLAELDRGDVGGGGVWVRSGRDRERLTHRDLGELSVNYRLLITRGTHR